MGNIKRFHSPNFKAKVALDMIREADTIATLCSKYSIHPTQAGHWKQQALAGLETIFSGRADNDLKAKDEMIEELYKQIGQLKVELDWLKKKLSVR
jgi:transposase-like protein